MPQNADKVIDHEMLFREPEYAEMLAGKRQFEFNHADVRIEEIRNWTKTPEYRDKNFARDMDMAISSPIWGLAKSAPWKQAA